MRFNLLVLVLGFALYDVGYWLGARAAQPNSLTAMAAAQALLLVSVCAVIFAMRGWRREEAALTSDDAHRDCA